MNPLSLKNVDASWFHTPEGHAVKHVIRALKANLFHDDYDGDPDLIRALLDAYWEAVRVKWYLGFGR